MPSIWSSRLALVVVGFLVLVSTFAGWQWLNWSPERILLERLSVAPEAISLGSTESDGSRLLLTELSWQDNNRQVRIQRVEAEFGQLSILLGRPQLTNLHLDGFEWLDSGAAGMASLENAINILIVLSPQQLEVTDLNLALGDHLSQFEGAARRLGASDRFQWHLNGWFALEDHEGSLNLGGSLRPTEAGLILTSLEADADLDLGPLTGRWSLKARALTLTAGQAEWDFLSWAGRWQPTNWTLTESVEWAGGIDAWRPGRLHQFGRIDSAIAFRDDQQQQHRVSLISSGLSPEGDTYKGSLSLSYRVEREASNDTPYEDSTLALEGRFEGDSRQWRWHNANLLLGLTIDDQQTRFQLDASELRYHPAQQAFHLVDGQWRHDISGEPPQLYGYSEMRGQWPGLSLTQAPEVAAELNHYLTELGTSLEWMNALQAALVSATGS